MTWTFVLRIQVQKNPAKSLLSTILYETNCSVVMALLYGVPAVPVEDDSFKEFVNGNHRFTAAVYKEVLKNEQGNFLVSPLSAETVLALANEGARGETSAELVSGLHLPDSKEKTQRALKSFLSDLKNFSDLMQLLSANKIYTAKDVKLEDDFQRVATEVYDSGIENVDFGNNVGTASKINGWVENKTNHKIKNLIDPASIGNDTKAILVNALYFKGKWRNEFETYCTYKEIFFRTEEDSVEVDMMHQTETFNFYESSTLNAKFLELAYKGSSVKLVIILPNEIQGLAYLEQNMERVLAQQNFSKQRVNLSLPKFTTETIVKFTPILKNLGVKKIFTKDADLSGISLTYKPLYVDEVLQKVFIKVTEEGTEAAAATYVGFVNHSGVYYRVEPLIFRADHPFLYFVQLDGVVLFIGRITNP